MDGSPESQLVAEPAVPFHESPDAQHSTVSIVEVLLLIEVPDHVPEVVGPMTKLGKLPVNDEELIDSCCGVVLSLRIIRNQDTDVQH